MRVSKLKTSLLAAGVCGAVTATAWAVALGTASSGSSVAETGTTAGTSVKRELVSVPDVGRLALLCNRTGPTLLQWTVATATEVVSGTGVRTRAARLLQPGQSMALSVRRPGVNTFRISQDRQPEKKVINVSVALRTDSCAAEQVDLRVRRIPHSPASDLP